MIAPYHYLSLPKPLPGELLNSHYRRILSFLNIPHKELLLDHLRRQPPEKRKFFAGYTEYALIAENCGMSAQQYISRHTLTHVSSLLLSRKKQSHSTSELLELNCRRDARFPRCDKTIVRCPDCAAKSLDEHGVSPLMRIHYLPLVDICLEHGAALERDCDGVIKKWHPGQRGNFKQWSSQDILDDNFHPLLRRYQEVCMHLLRAREKYCQPEVGSYALSVLGSYTSNNTLRSFWASAIDRIREKLPQAWLTHHLGTLLNSPDRFKAEMARSGHWTIFLLCTFLKSTDEVLRVVTQTAPQRYIDPEKSAAMAYKFDKWIFADRDSRYSPRTRTRQASS